MAPSPCPPLPTRFLACEPRPQSDGSVLRAALAFQALDAIERAQDLAEEVGNKVSPDSVSGAGVRSPGGIVGEGPRVRSHPEPFLVSRSCPSHPQTPAVSLSPRERCKGLGENSAVQRVAEFL